MGLCQLAVDERQLAFFTNPNVQSATTTALPASAAGTHHITYHDFGVMLISFRYSHSHDQHYRTETHATGCFIRPATRLATCIALASSSCVVFNLPRYSPSVLSWLSQYTMFY